MKELFPERPMLVVMVPEVGKNGPLLIIEEIKNAVGQGEKGVRTRHSTESDESDVGSSAAVCTALFFW